MREPRNRNRRVTPSQAIVYNADRIAISNPRTLVTDYFAQDVSTDKRALSFSFTPRFSEVAEPGQTLRETVSNRFRLSSRQKGTWLKPGENKNASRAFLCKAGADHDARLTCVFITTQVKT